MRDKLSELYAKRCKGFINDYAMWMIKKYYHKLQGSFSRQSSLSSMTLIFNKTSRLLSHQISMDDLSDAEIINLVHVFIAKIGSFPGFRDKNKEELEYAIKLYELIGADVIRSRTIKTKKQFIDHLVEMYAERCINYFSANNSILRHPSLRYLDSPPDLLSVLKNKNLLDKLTEFEKLLDNSKKANESLENAPFPPNKVPKSFFLRDPKNILNKLLLSRRLVIFICLDKLHIPDMIIKKILEYIEKEEIIYLTHKLVHYNLLKNKTKICHYCTPGEYCKFCDRTGNRRCLVRLADKVCNCSKKTPFEWNKNNDFLKYPMLYGELEPCGNESTETAHLVATEEHIKIMTKRWDRYNPDIIYELYLKGHYNDID